MLKKPTVLIVLDGWGYSESPKHNAIYAANTPVWDRLWATAPHSLISGSGMDVGLPEGQMGNSEVGHMTLGAGRVVWQSFTRITKAIKDGDFLSNPIYLEAIRKAKDAHGAVHILGLLSPGGVHSHEEHIFAMIELCAQQGVDRVYLHAFLDGRDTPPRSAESSLKSADILLRKKGIGRIASLTGRYFAMDRDNRWDRVQPVYDMLTLGQTKHHARTPLEGLADAYAREENDEFVLPTMIHAENEEVAKIRDGDAVIFMNFRADRARQLTCAFVDPNFSGFERHVRPTLADFVCTTEYSADIPAPVAFPPDTMSNSLGEYLSSLGKTQLRIAETEKYAHVTFFFSGGREELYLGEERILVPSPTVATYDLKPEMSAPEVTDKLCEAIESGHFDAIICNFANGDMVGHTGIFSAAVAAVEALDVCLGRIETSLKKVGGQCLITADHGNVECMMDEVNGQPLTSHTTEPVPLVYIGEKSLQLHSGTLADIAPTLLALMEIPQPKEMSGHNLIATP